MNAAVLSIVMILSATAVLVIPFALGRRLVRRLEREAADRRHRLLDRISPGARARGNRDAFSPRAERIEHDA